MWGLDYPLHNSFPLGAAVWTRIEQAMTYLRR